MDAQRVIVFFESGDCVAYSHSGEELWSRQLSSQYGPFVAEFGLGASPCQTSAHVFVLLEHDGPSYLLALDKGNGEVAWAAERTPRRSWSSPAIIQVMGQPQVVVSSAGSIDGYDPQSGELLWTFSDVGGNTGTTPIDCGQGRFLVGASAGRNGQSAAEAKRSNGMLQVERTAEGWHARRLWVAEDVSPSWASPIVYQGFAYWVNRAGVIFCFDAQTGEQVYAQRSKQPCWATPLASQERLYFFGKSGLVTVIAAGREFNKLAENQIWDEGQLPPEAPLAADEVTEERRRAAANFRAPTLYGYAVANGRLVARVGNQLFCIAQAP
ncbi:MAG: PQQ-binding-like beta-propeller repeat protein [Planctomycetales bacterium]|nr:PQQ-binding-like beta-propeller repeat protein [Planctomycetales bacterium]